jgi:MFS family permease
VVAGDEVQRSPGPGEVPTGSWRDLLAAGRRGTVAVLSGGVLLYAVDTYVTASLLPSAVAEIGGERFYAWVSTVYLLTAVVSAALVGRLLGVWPARQAYVLALVAFGVGTAIDVVAPDMAVLLVGRAVQGVGGGLLAGLAYALIRSALPRRLWTRASASISAMWGVGLLVGPALGGVFAEMGRWRLAFVVLVGVTVAVAAGVPAGLRRSSRAPTVSAGPFPLASLLLVTGAAAVLSVSGLAVSGSGVTARGVAVAAGGLVVALGLLAGLVIVERRAGDTGARVLPAATFRGGRLAALYLTIAAMIAVAAVEAFVPLFGQRLGGLEPVVAGFLGVALAFGWVGGEIVSASVGRARACGTAGPAVVVVAFAVLTATQHAAAGPAAVLLWAVSLALAGVGIGIAWPHQSAAAMSPGVAGEGSDGAAADDREGDLASSAITMVQMLAFALGASYAGVAVALGSDPVLSARLLYGGLGAIAVLGALAALRARPAL